MKFCIRQVLIAIGAILFLTFIVQSYIYSSYLVECIRDRPQQPQIGFAMYSSPEGGLYEEP